jgi:hypothetical protein
MNGPTTAAPPPRSVESGVGRPSWASFADAVGHCLLIFAFVPLLASLPDWIAFEATNPLNVRDPVVLAFVLARGFDRLLDAFGARALVGVTAGVAYGLFLCLLMRRGGPPPTPRARLALGTIGGVIAASIGIVVAHVVRSLLQHEPDTQRHGAAFEIAAGLVCGLVATPGALRLLARPPATQADPGVPGGDG